MDEAAFGASWGAMLSAVAGLSSAGVVRAAAAQHGQLNNAARDIIFMMYPV
jgi:hypothetical protein